jgi:hypothetical protein
MAVKHFMALVCVSVVAVTAVMARDVGDVVSGDVNGDHRVDVLDLQIIIAKVLDSPNAAIVNGLSGDGRANVLDFQRALAQAQHPGQPVETPPAKNVLKGCFFVHQGEWTVEPAGQTEEPGNVDTSSLSRSPCFDRPTRCVIPIVTERYLFRLTPNAPPVFA